MELYSSTIFLESVGTVGEIIKVSARPRSLVSLAQVAAKRRTAISLQSHRCLEYESMCLCEIRLGAAPFENNSVIKEEASVAQRIMRD